MNRKDKHQPSLDHAARAAPTSDKRELRAVAHAAFDHAYPRSTPRVPRQAATSVEYTGTGQDQS